MPDGLAALHALGLQLPLAESYPFGGIRFLTSALSAEAPFPGSECGRAVRRIILHRFMIERAEQVGVQFLWRTPVTGISPSAVHLGKSTVRSRWIVGADGAHSRVRHWARLEKSSRPRLRFAFRRHYRVAPWTDHVEVYWGHRYQGYAVGVSPEQVCVVLASHDPNLRLEDGLRHLPRLRERLATCEPVSTERGAITGNRRLGSVWRGNVALIGDAAGTVDAITGEGLGLAFRQAVALAHCLESGNLAPYQLAHRRLMLRPLMMARLMLTLDGCSSPAASNSATLSQASADISAIARVPCGSVARKPAHLRRLQPGIGLLTANLCASSPGNSAGTCRQQSFCWPRLSRLPPRKTLHSNWIPLRLR